MDVWFISMSLRHGLAKHCQGSEMFVTKSNLWISFGWGRRLGQSFWFDRDLPRGKRKIPTVGVGTGPHRNDGLAIVAYPQVPKHRMLKSPTTLRISGLTLFCLLVAIDMWNLRHTLAKDGRSKGRVICFAAKYVPRLS